MDAQQSANVSMHYTCMWPDDNAADWFKTISVDILAARFVEDKLVVPGHTRTESCT